MSLDGTKPGKEDPSHHVGKVEGLGDSLPSPQGCIPHHIDGMAGEQQTEQHKAPLLSVVEGGATLYIPGVGQWPSLGCTYACHR